MDENKEYLEINKDNAKEYLSKYLKDGILTIIATVCHIGYKAFFKEEEEITNLLFEERGDSNSTLSIYEYAFACTNIKILYFPPFVKYIGEYAFYMCFSLQSVIFMNDYSDILSIVYNKGSTICSFAFESCMLLENVEISNCVKCIHDWAFKDTSYFKKILIPDFAYPCSSDARNRIYAQDIGYHIAIYENIPDELTMLLQHITIQELDNAITKLFYYMSTATAKGNYWKNGISVFTSKNRIKRIYAPHIL